MKCFGLWINDDGTAQVAELSPEQGQSLVEQVDAQPAESVEQAMQMLSEMLPDMAAPNPESTAEQDAMRGYSKSPRQMPAKMGPGKVFGEGM